jgi:hypothetical protein
VGPGDTIVNAKLGLRIGSGNADFYASYGRALTGDVWYKDIVRLEFRLGFERSMMHDPSQGSKSDGK